MESQSLQTASLYINNLLLSRGLLRDGAAIDFAMPLKADGGGDATMARILNLVHDLVLRRDRDTEQREQLAQTIHGLRRAETTQTLELSRLQTRHTDTQRQLAIAQGQERAFKATLRTAENAARGLREEMLRLKTMLQQVRSQCANDIRKRDLQIQRLKSHLTSQQRGTRPPLTTATITITPTHHPSLPQPGRDDGAVPLDSPDYTLTQETTEFLTQLSQNLSNENDNLIGLVRSTLTTLRAVQGLPAAGPAPAVKRQAGVSIEGGDEAVDTSTTSQSLVDVVPTYDMLATEMDEVLEHLRSLLTNPSFVPLEEVEVREEEIHRLRDGWEKMEGRWREAVQMMEGWRKRMARGGKAVNLDELRLGLSLSPIKVEKEPNASADEQQHDHGGSSTDDDDNRPTTKDYEDEDEDDVIDGIDDDDHEALGVGLRPDGAVLGPVQHNRHRGVRKPRAGIPTIAEEDPPDAEEATEDVFLLEVAAAKPKASHVTSDLVKANAPDSKIPRHTLKRANTSAADGRVEKKTKISKQIIQQKLDGARSEADLAQKRRREAAAKPGLPRRKLAAKGPIKGARRRSTLTKEELNSLIKGHD